MFIDSWPLDALIDFKSVQYQLACLVSFVIANPTFSDSENRYYVNTYLCCAANLENFEDLIDKDNSYDQGRL